MTTEGGLFPPSPRVVYGKAPLTQVTCQLRFPQILRIESQAPAEFQERIREIFPLVERQRNDFVNLPPDVAQLMGIDVQANTGFQFRTEDQKHTLGLASEALSLTSREYGEWETFRGYLLPALDSLTEIYKPSFYVRIGLRYVNVIQRSSLDLDDRAWVDLLRKEILGELSMGQFAANVVDARRQLRVQVPDESGYALYLQHGFAKRKSSPEVVYRLDFDFYRGDKTEVSDAKSVLNKLNAMVGRAFRWCITETLHQRLEPRALELAER